MLHVLRTAGAGGSLLDRGRHAGAVLRSGRAGARSLIELRCERGAGVVRAIGLGEIAARAIMDLDEHWDGGGYPAGISGDEISLAGRVLCLAQTAEVFWQRGGPRRRVRDRPPSGVELGSIHLVDASSGWNMMPSSGGRYGAAAVDGGRAARARTRADEARLDLVAHAFASIVDANRPTPRPLRRGSRDRGSLAALLDCRHRERVDPASRGAPARHRKARAYRTGYWISRGRWARKSGRRSGAIPDGRWRYSRGSECVRRRSSDRRRAP